MKKLLMILLLIVFFWIFKDNLSLFVCRDFLFLKIRISFINKKDNYIY